MMSLKLCVTRYGSYKLLIMLFGLTNASSTFCNLMYDMLFGYLDDFVVVYLDDIFIYSWSLDDHLEHLSLVMSCLREYNLYVTVKKYEFAKK